MKRRELERQVRELKVYLDLLMKDHHKVSMELFQLELKVDILEHGPIVE